MLPYQLQIVFLMAINLTQLGNAQHSTVIWGYFVSWVNIGPHTKKIFKEVQYPTYAANG